MLKTGCTMLLGYMVFIVGMVLGIAWFDKPPVQSEGKPRTFVSPDDRVTGWKYRADTAAGTRLAEAAFEPCEARRGDAGTAFVSRVRASILWGAALGTNRLKGDFLAWTDVAAPDLRDPARVPLLPAAASAPEPEEAAPAPPALEARAPLAQRLQAEADLCAGEAVPLARLVRAAACERAVATLSEAGADGRRERSRRLLATAADLEKRLRLALAVAEARERPEEMIAAATELRRLWPEDAPDADPWSRTGFPGRAREMRALFEGALRWKEPRVRLAPTSLEGVPAERIVRVIAVVRPIGEGEPIYFSALVSVEMDRNRVAADQMAADKIAEVIRRRAAIDLPAGTLLIASHLRKE